MPRFRNQSLFLQRFRVKTEWRFALAAMAVAWAVTFEASGQGLPCGYTVDVVYGPDCGGGSFASVFGSGIGNEGDLSGWFECPGGLEDAFVAWNAGTLTPLSFPAGVNQSRAIDVNGDVIVGHYATVNGYRGFRRQGASFTTIEPLAGGNWVEVSRANSAGVIVGGWGNTIVGPYPRAFRWQNGVMTDMSPQLIAGRSQANDISPSGLITGFMGQTAFPSNARAFIWNNGQVTNLGLMAGSIGTQGVGINDNGQVCGIAWFTAANSAGYVRRGFFWQNGVFTDLGTFPGYTEVFPQAISDDGTVVGWAAVAPGLGGTKAFVWKASILQELPVIHVVDAFLYPYVPRDINSSGDIGSSGALNSKTVAVRYRAVVREPGDTNCDFLVNVTDLLAVINRWGQSGVHEDVNGDFIVNVTDLLMVISNWG